MAIRTSPIKKKEVNCIKSFLTLSSAASIPWPITIKTSKERAPPLPLISPASFSNSYKIGINPETTAVIENIRLLFDSKASHIDSKLIPTIEIPNSQDTIFSDHVSQGPTPAITSASGVNVITDHPNAVSPSSCLT